jgi:hypothetical protein
MTDIENKIISKIILSSAYFWNMVDFRDITLTSINEEEEEEPYICYLLFY